MPILVKDNIETRDQPTTAGSLALKDNMTGRDAPVIARLRAAGAVILGKTNLSEWANIRSSASMSGWSAVGVLVRNPYALDRSACGSSSGSGSGSGDTLKVGIKFDQPGMGLKAGSDYTGMDVDIAKYVAKELGKTPEFSEAVSAQRETLLKTGKVDYIVGTYSITDKRKQDVDFAGPYFIAGQDLLVKADSTIDGPDAMNGKKMCSVKGSTSASKWFRCSTRWTCRRPTPTTREARSRT